MSQVSLVTLLVKKLEEGEEKAWISEYPPALEEELAPLMSPRTGVGAATGLALDIRTAVGVVVPPLRIDAIMVTG